MSIMAVNKPQSPPILNSVFSDTEYPYCFSISCGYLDSNIHAATTELKRLLQQAGVHDYKLFVEAQETEILFRNLIDLNHFNYAMTAAGNPNAEIGMELSFPQTSPQPLKRYKKLRTALARASESSEFKGMVTVLPDKPNERRSKMIENFEQNGLPDGHIVIDGYRRHRQIEIIGYSIPTYLALWRSIPDNRKALTYL